MKFIHYLGRVNDLPLGALVATAAIGLLGLAGLALYVVIQMAPGNLFS